MNFKLKRSLLFATLICGTAWADDNNSFYFTDAAILPGETTDIELCMRNTVTDLTCLEAEIQLPEGLTVACDDEGAPIATLYRDRTPNHELITNVLDNGNLKLLVSSISGNMVNGKEGPLLCFRVKAAETAPLGEWTVVETIGESLLVNSKAVAYYSVGVIGYILITDDETSIKTINDVQGSTNEDIYNLAGQRVSKPKNGIFIRGGMKKLYK